MAVLAMASTYVLTPHALVDDLRPMAGDGFEKILLAGVVDCIERWEAHLASRADLHGRIRATLPNPCYVEVTEHGVSKCSALLFLLGNLGIAPPASEQPWAMPHRR